MGRFKSRHVTADQDHDATRPKPTPAAASQPVYDPGAPIPRHLQVRGRAEDNSPGRKAAIAVDYAKAGGEAGKDGSKVTRNWEVDASLPASYLKQTKACQLVEMDHDSDDSNVGGILRDSDKE